MSSALNFIIENRDRNSCGSAQFVVATDKHELGLLYIKCELVLV